LYEKISHDSNENISFMRLYSKIEKAKNLKEDEQNLLAALLSH
jgi:hypothetical protein